MEVLQYLPLLPIHPPLPPPPRVIFQKYLEKDDYVWSNKNKYNQPSIPPSVPPLYWVIPCHPYVVCSSKLQNYDYVFQDKQEPTQEAQTQLRKLQTRQLLVHAQEISIVGFWSFTTGLLWLKLSHKRPDLRWFKLVHHDVVEIYIDQVVASRHIYCDDLEI